MYKSESYLLTIRFSSKYHTEKKNNVHPHPKKSRAKRGATRHIQTSNNNIWSSFFSTITYTITAPNNPAQGKGPLSDTATVQKIYDVLDTLTSI